MREILDYFKANPPKEGVEEVYALLNRAVEQGVLLDWSAVWQQVDTLHNRAAGCLLTLHTPKGQSQRFAIGEGDTPLKAFEDALVRAVRQFAPKSSEPGNSVAERLAKADAAISKLVDELKARGLAKEVAQLVVKSGYKIGDGKTEADLEKAGALYRALKGLAS